MKSCQFLMTIHCNLKMLLIRERRESLFRENEHDYVGKLYFSF